MSLINYQKWVVCDIDSTLSNPAHRIEFAITKQWDKFHSLCHLDQPNMDIIEMVGYISEHCNILILTGRYERYREITIAWLAKQKLSPDVILMRPDAYRR